MMLKPDGSVFQKQSLAVKLRLELKRHVLPVTSIWLSVTRF